VNMEGTLLLYVLIGLAVGAALSIRDPRRAILWLTLGVLFWPLFLPLLFSPRTPAPKPPRKDLSALRDEVARLDPPLPELVAALDAADRIREGKDELGRLLETQQAALAQDEPALAKSERTREVLEARRADLERLRAVRDEQEERHLRLTAQVREAITKAHLARFSAPARQELRKHLLRLSDELSLLNPNHPG